MDISEILKDLEKGLPIFIPLKNFSLSKITQLTLSDNENESLYEILTTAPDSYPKEISMQKFLYKKLINFNEIKDFLIKNYLE